MAHPFGSPGLVVEDSLRVLIVVLGIALVFAYIAIVVNNDRRRFTNATAWGLGAQLFAVVFIVGTEITRIGHSMFEGHYWWRLPTGVAAVALMVKTAVEVHRYPVQPPERGSPFGES